MVSVRRHVRGWRTYLAGGGLVLGLGLLLIVPAHSQEHPNQQYRAQHDTNPAACQEVPHEGFWGKAEEDPVAAFTGILALFTILLVVVSSIQIGFLIRADKTGRLAAEAAKTSAVAARDAAEAATSQSQEARREYIRNHRPRLRVRHFTLGPNDVTAGNYVEGEFEVVNIGGAKAQIINSHCEVFRSVDLPLKRPYLGRDPSHAVPGNPIIEAGSSEIGTFVSEAPLPSPGTGPHGTITYVMGWIDYSDDNGTRRRTAFCREHRSRDKGRRFFASDNPDYDYED